jgi:hypothetical protein
LRKKEGCQNSLFVFDMAQQIDRVLQPIHPAVGRRQDGREKRGGLGAVQRSTNLMADSRSSVFAEKRSELSFQCRFSSAERVHTERTCEHGNRGGRRAGKKGERPPCNACGGAAE